MQPKSVYWEFVDYILSTGITVAKNLKPQK